jgi:hypothetical protein
VVKKKIWANFQRIKELFTQKIVTKLSKIWVWDPGSVKNLFRIPDPEVKNAPDPGSQILDPGSRIPDPDPQHWYFLKATITYLTESVSRILGRTYATV